MPLFRSEALTQRADRLPGAVVVAVPIAWELIAYLVFIGVSGALIFLSLASYSSVEVAGGTIQPNKGVVSITPTRSGIVTALYVCDGQQVRDGTLLAWIRVEESTANTLSVADEVEAAIGEQKKNLAAQIRALRESADAQQMQFKALRSGLVSEIAQLTSQIALQRKLIDSATKDLTRARAVAARGFISGRDLQQREEVVLARTQQLLQLQQSLGSKRSDLAQAGRNVSLLAAQSNSQIASIAGLRAQVDQQAAITHGGRAYGLRAPVTGLVTALTARIGQPASPQTPLMAIIPADSILQAQLAVPSAAIGFVKPGMEVSLAIDAFLYTRFGTVKGKIMTVASAAIGQPGPNGNTVAVYPVTVALRQNTVSAYGHRELLVPGMTLTARIVTKRQSLLQWLFDPLFAVWTR